MTKTRTNTMVTLHDPLKSFPKLLLNNSETQQNRNTKTAPFPLGYCGVPWESTHRETNAKCIMPDIFASMIFMRYHCAGKATQMVNYF